MWFVIGGIIGVLVTIAWEEFLAWNARKAQQRRDCEMRGHQWKEPFYAMGSYCRNCRHCGHQQHYNKETDEWR